LNQSTVVLLCGEPALSDQTKFPAAAAKFPAAVDESSTSFVVI